MDNISELVEELGLFDEDKPVFIEINGVAHKIAAVTDDSQGVYITVDDSIEERQMR